MVDLCIDGRTLLKFVLKAVVLTKLTGIIWLRFKTIVIKAGLFVSQ